MLLYDFMSISGRNIPQAIKLAISKRVKTEYANSKVKPSPERVFVIALIISALEIFVKKIAA